jgi:hypothetical protein
MVTTCAGVVGVEQWAEIRRLHRIEASIRTSAHGQSLHRKTISSALEALEPPKNSRPAGCAT